MRHSRYIMKSNTGLLGCLWSMFVVVAAVSQGERHIIDSLSQLPQGWVYQDVAPKSHMIKMHIVLEQPGWDRLEEHLLDASNPQSKNYGSWLSKSELNSLVATSEVDFAAVTDWLQEHGIHDYDQRFNVLSFSSPVSQAQSLLNTSFSSYQHTTTGARRVRTANYSVPSHLKDVVKMVQPTTTFGHPGYGQRVLHESLKKRQSGINFSNCTQFNTPACLRELYSISNYTSTHNVTRIAMNSFDNDYAQYDDLEAFEKQFAPYAIGQNYTWTSINGGQELQNGAGSGEANLDVQLLTGLTYPLPVHIYSTGGTGPVEPGDPDFGPGSVEPWLEALTYLLSLPDDQLPTTISTSYAEDEQAVPESYTAEVCKLFGQLAARGVSIINGSGDFGVGGDCQLNDGKNTTAFLPTFPAGCPYVTSVGGTTGKNPETAAPGSSGGFSNRFARPSWQESAVEAYLQQLGDQWQGLYNRSGRAFPDVAAQYDSYIVVDDGEVDADSGTSASGPVFASIIALLNDARVANGLAPLGFLNPWLYSSDVAATFTDITSGKSDGCYNDFIDKPAIPNAGFSAVPGFDPVTGLGTPNYQKLYALAVPRAY